MNLERYSGRTLAVGRATQRRGYKLFSDRRRLLAFARAEII